jgi:hypothetical protein
MNFPLTAYEFEMSDEDLFNLDVYDLDEDILDADLDLDADLTSEAEWPWYDDQHDFQPVDDQRLVDPDERRDDLPVNR